MLVLSRKKGQSFYVGDHIKITVLEQHDRAGLTRIGIEAPREITIEREEIHQTLNFGKESHFDTNNR